jgi:regulator of PEP synthase PpsR (kinase-PPPase family)
VFFVSDGTGITAQMLGHSLLTQFEGVEFKQITLPFVDSRGEGRGVPRAHRG